MRVWTTPALLLLTMAPLSVAHAQPSGTNTPSTSAATGPTKVTPKATSPTPVPKATPEAAPSPPLARWTDEEIEAARARCTAVLANVKAVTISVPPVREGDCGAPAAVELISLGSAPPVAFSPPAVVTCDMVATLDKWFENDVQPAARSLLGGPIVRVHVMSSYSCRGALNRKLSRLSEHGRANAIDIGSFVSDRGLATHIRADWGMTQRDLKAIALAMVEAARLEAARKANEASGAPRHAVEMAEAARTGTKGAAGPAGAAAPRTARQRGSRSDARLALPRIDSGSAVGSSLLSLGGPKGAQAVATPLPALPTAGRPEELFLRRIHASACKTFATVLGPEANEAHRDHFHIDLAERKSASYCE